MKTPLQRIRIGALSLAIVFVAAILGYHYLGNYDWLDSAWMVFITVSTVGYGEHSNSSDAVQILTMMLIVFGVSSSVYTFGGFIQLLLEGEVERAFGRRKMTKEIDRLEHHVIICGYGKMGRDLVAQLEHREIPFVVVDIDPEKSRLAQASGLLSINGDATSETILELAHLDTARALVTALPTDAENVFITLTGRNIRADVQIIAKSEHESSCGKLRQAGADNVVMPHRIGAQQMERMISRPKTAALVELFAEASHLEMELDEFRVNSNSGLEGLTLADSKIKEQFNLLVVGIQKLDGDFQFNPSSTNVIQSSDTLLVMGNLNDINRMKSASRT
ncbi:MAG: NAD-binding protein [Mariniblastus sp.]|nr:NAD-binding protein [Mariniblastus sp.]